MKKIVILLFLNICSYFVFSQDIIYTKSGKRVDCKIIKTDSIYVYFDTYMNDKKVYTNVKKSDISHIKYENGSYEFINKTYLPIEDSKVVIFRQRSFFGAGVIYTIYEDNIPISLIRSGTYVEYYCPPGEVKFTARTETKEMISKNMDKGEVSYLECFVKFGFFIGRPTLDFVDNISAQDIISKLDTTNKRVIHKNENLTEILSRKKIIDVYGEFIGPGAMGSINTEYRFLSKNKMNFAGRIGVGYFEAFSIPIGFTLNIGEKNNFFETGIGTSFQYINDPDWFEIDPYLTIGYRYEKPYSRFLFRANINIIYSQTFIPILPGISLGYSF